MTEVAGGAVSYVRRAPTSGCALLFVALALLDCVVVVVVILDADDGAALRSLGDSRVVVISVADAGARRWRRAM